MALPAIAALSAAFPSASLDVFVGTHSRAVFEVGCKASALYDIPSVMSWDSAVRTSRRLRRRRYDLVANLDRSRWLRVAVRCARPTRFAEVVAASPERRHESEVYLDVVRSLGIPTDSNEPTIDTSNFERPAALPKSFAIIHPGGGSNPGSHMAGKRWETAAWVLLARHLSKRGLHVACTGSSAERELGDEIITAAAIDATNLAGTLSLRDTIEVIAFADLFVGPDTGLVHAAAACGVPTIAIFGPTNPDRYAPRGPCVSVCAAPGSRRIEDVDLRRVHAVPDDARIDLVRVESVLEACDQFLDSPMHVEC